VELPVRARREDVDVLVDAGELPGAVAAEPLVADVIDGPLGSMDVDLTLSTVYFPERDTR